MRGVSVLPMLFIISSTSIRSCALFSLLIDFLAALLWNLSYDFSLESPTDCVSLEQVRNGLFILRISDLFYPTSFVLHELFWLLGEQQESPWILRFELSPSVDS